MAVIRRGIHFGSYGRVDDGAAVFRRLADAARAAEDAGFDAISVPDHVHQNQIGGGPASPMFEAYTVLGALALVTSEATLFALVSPVTLRPPGLLAKAVTTLDVVSGGRALLGVGAGWDAAESEAYGIDFPGLGERFDRLDEELAVCRALLRDERSTFTGKFYAVRDAYNSPRPVRGSVPVLVAGGGEKRTLDLVARYADMCNVFAGDPADVRHKFDVLDRHCERAGRDPAEITRTVFAVDTSDLAALEASARALAAAGADGMIVVGPEDPARIAAVGRLLGEVFPD
ncbi:MAG TPA: TIGR03560 family F420-dependent LLM class oxidoreductase [Trebonia sp.]|nr:TIGR03560 family F420-dependent LLM class oxidoreductase [Trebonia sp.]